MPGNGRTRPNAVGLLAGLVWYSGGTRIFGVGGGNNQVPPPDKKKVVTWVCRGRLYLKLAYNSKLMAL